MPQATNNLELICGSVAVIGDLTKPFVGTEYKEKL